VHSRDDWKEWQVQLETIIDPQGPPVQSVSKSRQSLLTELFDGDLATCPTCRGRAKVYRRPMTGAMAVALAKLVKATNEREFVHIPTVLHDSALLLADVQKLVHWGMLEPMPGERDDGSNRNGFYCVSPRGRAFVYGRLTVPERVILYNAQCLGLDGPPVDIRDVLPKGFDYEELMRR
jgi:hypothetical protein